MARLEDDVAVAPQHLARERADGVLVLDEQHRLPSVRLVRAALIGGGRLRESRCSVVREVDLERRAVSRLAVDPDVAAALFHHAVNSGETEAGALALFLGREERLEYARARLLRPCLRRYR